MSHSASPALLEAKGLTKQFPVGGLLQRRRRVVHALSDVSLSLFRGETVGIVGESGCGKSTLARCLLHLVVPTGGQVLLEGRAVDEMLRTDPLAFRRAVQIVFQDPYASLNPRRSIGQSIADPLRIFGMTDDAARRLRVAELLRQVGLPADFGSRYPHELSGGQRQRVAIARALAPGPKVIVCDEAVSSLDVSVQAQIINLLRDIQADTGVAYLFISHNLNLVERIADRIIVMYLGQIVESGSGDVMRAQLLHPYSQALFASAPVLRRDRGVEARPLSAPLQGEVPNPIDPPTGCRFHPRCRFRQAVCDQTVSELSRIASREVRCQFAGRLQAST